MNNFSRAILGLVGVQAEYCVPTWITDFINVTNVFGKVWILQLGQTGAGSDPPAAGGGRDG